MYHVYPITFARWHRKASLVLHVTQPKALEHRLLALSPAQPARGSHPLLLLTLPSYSLTPIKMLLTLARVLPWGLGLHSQTQWDHLC